MPDVACTYKPYTLPAGSPYPSVYAAYTVTCKPTWQAQAQMPNSSCRVVTNPVSLPNGGFQYDSYCVAGQKPYVSLPTKPVNTAPVKK